MKQFLILLLLVPAVLGETSNGTSTLTTDATATTKALASQSTSQSTSRSTETTVTLGSTHVSTEPTTDPSSSSSHTSEATTSESKTSTSGTTVITTPPTTVPPTPAPSTKFDGDGSWNATGDNGTCLKITMSAQLAVDYEHLNNKTVTTHINLPPNATATGSCEEHENSLVLSWKPYKLTLLFRNNLTNDETIDKRERYGLYHLVFKYTINNDDFPGAKDLGGAYELSWTMGKDPALSGHDGRSYKCNAKTDITLTGTDNSPNGTFSVESVQLQAFGTHLDNFGDVEECESDEKTDDIVPIAVGCALAGLVIIVLIAYLVGRRRSRQKGYQSV